MGSCDFTTSSYSFAEAADDFALAHFDSNATRDRTTLIPLIRRAMEVAGAPLRLFGTPWSPPYWMKTNNNMNGTSNPCIKADAQQRYHRAWALYFLKWIQTYEKYGVPIWSAPHTALPPLASPQQQPPESWLTGASDALCYARVGE